MGIKCPVQVKWWRREASPVHHHPRWWVLFSQLLSHDPAQPKITTPQLRTEERDLGRAINNLCTSSIPPSFLFLSYTRKRHIQTPEKSKSGSGELGLARWEDGSHAMIYSRMKNSSFGFRLELYHGPKIKASKVTVKLRVKLPNLTSHVLFHPIPGRGRQTSEPRPDLGRALTLPGRTFPQIENGMN